MCLPRRTSKGQFAPVAFNLSYNNLQLINEFDLLPISLEHFRGEVGHLDNAELSRLVSRGARRYHNVAQSRNYPDQTYIDKRLLRSLRKWLDGSFVWREFIKFASTRIHQFWHQVTSVEAMRGQPYELSEGQLANRTSSIDPTQRDQVSIMREEALPRQEAPSERSERVKAEVVEVLHISKWLNILTVISYAFLIRVAFIDSFRLKHTIGDTKTKSGWELSRPMESAATSWPFVDYSSRVRYLSAAVIALDLLNILYWFHNMNTMKRVSKEETSSYKFRKQKSSYVWTVSCVLANPRHLFKLTWASLLIYPISLDCTSTVRLLGLSQFIWHGYNLYRVMDYLRVLQGRPITEPRGQPTGQIGCLCGRITGGVGRRSGWPLSLFKCDCEQVWQAYLERILMIGQVVAVKTALMSLLLQIDNKKVQAEPFLVFSLLVQILAVYSYYNKYLDRFSREQPVEGKYARS